MHQGLGKAICTHATLLENNLDPGHLNCILNLKIWWLNQKLWHSQVQWAESPKCRFSAQLDGDTLDFSSIFGGLLENKIVLIIFKRTRIQYGCILAELFSFLFVYCWKISHNCFETLTRLASEIGLDWNNVVSTGTQLSDGLFLPWKSLHNTSIVIAGLRFTSFDML